MPRMRKLDYQMHLRMEQMNCIGESRHQAKHEYKEMLHVGKHANTKRLASTVIKPTMRTNKLALSFLGI